MKRRNLLKTIPVLFSALFFGNKVNAKIVTPKKGDKSKIIQIRGGFIKIGKSLYWIKINSIVEVYNGCSGNAAIILSGVAGSKSFEGITAEQIIAALEEI